MNQEKCKSDMEEDAKVCRRVDRSGLALAARVVSPKFRCIVPLFPSSTRAARANNLFCLVTASFGRWKIELVLCH